MSNEEKLEKVRNIANKLYFNPEIDLDQEIFNEFGITENPNEIKYKISREILEIDNMLVFNKE